MNTLNNGRTCKASYECKSQKCQGGRCVGLRSGEFCYDHADCDTGMFCEMGKAWPWTYQCSKLKKNYEACNETYECGVQSFCWYKTSNDVTNGDKKCLPLYSQDFGVDFGWSSNSSLSLLDNNVFNGKFCKSGLAF